MRHKTIGMTASRLATLGLVIVLGAGMAGCKSDGSKAAPAAPVGATGATGGSGVTAPPVPTNRAPTVSGTSVTTAKVTFPYTYQPTASDADGDPLTFAIRNKPDWATFDTVTGRLAGTPPAGSTGTLPVVQITVSDGKASASMDLSIDVVGLAVGSATLAWQPPKTNVDGTPLSDLAGYVVRYGKSADNLDQSLRIGGADITSCVVENLIEGTWYFSLAAVNSQGIESDPAGYVSKTIG